jgi:glycosyltransferase involved in cell wall biosynthesis
LTESLPRISIITPSYQQAAFLEQTILSVLSQNYANLEYMLIDGGSSDGSVDVIEKYEDRLAYWVSEKDQGQADAINKGLQKATGEFIGWINSDDYYLPGTLVQVAETFQQNPQAGLIYGDVLAVDSEDRPINLMRYQNWTAADLLQFRMIGQSSVFFRRSTLEKSGLLERRYHYLLDHQLWLRMALHDNMIYVPNVWSAARYHAGAKNIAEAAHFGADALNILDWAAKEKDFTEIWKRNEKQAKAGAAWFNAFYFSDAGLYGQSLKNYAKVLLLSPKRFIEDWKKALYTFFAWLKIGFITRRMEEMNHQRRKAALRKNLQERNLITYLDAMEN